MQRGWRRILINTTHLWISTIRAGAPYTCGETGRPNCCSAWRLRVFMLLPLPRGQPLEVWKDRDPDARTRRRWTVGQISFSREALLGSAQEMSHTLDFWRALCG